MTNLFQDDSDNSIDPDKDYFSELVGEGKKYKDQTAAGRALVEKDSFIDRLKAEAAGLRQELSTRLKLEEVVSKISSATPPNNDDNQNREQGLDKAANQLTSEDVSKLVTQAMSETEKKTQRAKNTSYVEETLKEAFGPTFRRTIKAQAEKLGVGEEFLSTLAQDQPNAFLKLMDVGERRENNSTATNAPHTTVNTEALRFRPSNSVKRMSHYEEMRKKEPKKYWSVAVQNEIHAEALKQGESFFQK